MYLQVQQTGFNNNCKTKDTESHNNETVDTKNQVIYLSSLPQWYGIGRDHELHFNAIIFLLLLLLPLIIIIIIFGIGINNVIIIFPSF